MQVNIDITVNIIIAIIIMNITMAKKRREAYLDVMLKG